METFPIKNCRDCGPQPITDFYRSSFEHNRDGRHPYCKTCHKRRATIAQRRRRNTARVFSERLATRRSERFIERHVQKRAEEAAVEESLLREKQGLNNEHYQDAFCFINRKPMFTGFLRLKSKSSRWRVA